MSRFSWASNLRDAIPGIAELSEALLGISKHRPWPVWSAEPIASDEEQPQNPNVALFVDTFSRWFEPELVMPDHQTFTDTELNHQLHQVIGRLYEKNILLIHTDHLSDRQLYCLIARDILPAEEKKIVLTGKFLKWQCLDIVEDEESWLRFYATEEERHNWVGETGLRLPPRESIPFPRKLPQHA